MENKKEKNVIKDKTKKKQRQKVNKSIFLFTPIILTAVLVLSLSLTILNDSIKNRYQIVSINPNYQLELKFSSNSNVAIKHAWVKDDNIEFTFWKKSGNDSTESTTLKLYYQIVANEEVLAEDYVTNSIVSVPYNPEVETYYIYIYELETVEFLENTEPSYEITINSEVIVPYVNLKTCYVDGVDTEEEQVACSQFVNMNYINTTTDYYFPSSTLEFIDKYLGENDVIKQYQMLFEKVQEILELWNSKNELYNSAGVSDEVINEFMAIRTNNNYYIFNDLSNNYIQLEAYAETKANETLTTLEKECIDNGIDLREYNATKSDRTVYDNINTLNSLLSS